LIKIITRLLPLLLLLIVNPGHSQAQQANGPPNLNLGDAVVTGFSGTLAPEASKRRAANKSTIDHTFINPDGPSARIVGVGKPGYVWDGRLFEAPKTFDVLAKDVGQVFGVALDDATPPNIYLAATSVFGLNIVRRGRDSLPERRKNGGPGAGWMKAQFGLDLQGGPGAIYKVDGATGAVTLFANVTLDGVPNPGPALGNLAYDSAHKQLFVSDLYTGMIHRFALDGGDSGAPYDHGVAGLTAAKLPALAFDPKNRPNIASDRFDSEDPNSWGYAPAARRVWGLAVHDGRLFYSARNGSRTDGPQIWSVGIAADGNFASDPRWELDVAAKPGPFAISDIAFSQSGAMILAQRAPAAGAYDYVAFTQAGEPRVLRYRLKDPNDPPSPSRWKEAPEEYAIGLAGDYRNGNGGVALGYGYDKAGALQSGSCEAALWSTGQSLRNNPAQRSQLESGGPLAVNGLQGSPADLVRNENAPPTLSYFIDYDGKFDDARASGHMGSVRILTKPCTGAVAVSSPAAVAAGGGGGGGGGACVCKRPFLPGPVPGQCVCPQGTVIQGDECVPEICPPPTTPGPVPGVCICHEKGGPCSCPPPLIAGPSPGECVWPLQTKQCVGITGSIIVKKEVTTYNTQIPWPTPGPLFPMTLTCLAPPQSWSFSLNKNGTYTANNIPFGKTCTVAEGAMPAFPPNLCPRGTVPMWTPSPFTTPASVVINGTTVTMIVHNSVTCVPRERIGELTATKKVSPDPRGIGNILIFPMTVTCTNPPPPISYTLNVPGNTSTVPANVLVGNHCVVTETQPALPAGCTWLPPIFSPPNGVIIHSGLNQEIVTNGYRCRDCPPPQIMNKDGVCVCPDDEVLVDGKCVPATVCKRPLVMIHNIGCRCPDGEEPVDGKCEKAVVCDRPLVLNSDRTKCVEAPKSRPKPSKTCKRGSHWNGDMCVKNKTEPKEERRRDRQRLDLPNFPSGGSGKGGGQGSGKR
jgi:hypothetical protein